MAAASPSECLSFLELLLSSVPLRSEEEKKRENIAHISKKYLRNLSLNCLIKEFNKCLLMHKCSVGLCRALAHLFHLLWAQTAAGLLMGTA